MTLSLGRTLLLGGPLLEGPLGPALELLPKLPLARDPGRLPPPVASRSSFNTLSTVLRLMNLCAGGQGPGRGELPGSKHSGRAAMRRTRHSGRRRCSPWVVSGCPLRLMAFSCVTQRGPNNQHSFRHAVGRLRGEQVHQPAGMAPLAPLLASAPVQQLKRRDTRSRPSMPGATLPSCNPTAPAPHSQQPHLCLLALVHAPVTACLVKFGIPADSGSRVQTAAGCLAKCSASSPGDACRQLDLASGSSKVPVGPACLSTRQ